MGAEPAFPNYAPNSSCDRPSPCRLWTSPSCFFIPSFWNRVWLSSFFMPSLEWPCEHGVLGDGVLEPSHPCPSCLPPKLIGRARTTTPPPSKRENESLRVESERTVNSSSCLYPCFALLAGKSPFRLSRAVSMFAYALRPIRRATNRRVNHAVFAGTNWRLSCGRWKSERRCRVNNRRRPCCPRCRQHRPIQPKRRNNCPSVAMPTMPPKK